jgi:hypothetical protein
MGSWNKLCILKDESTTTLTYLKTAFEHCDNKYGCQNYFCKKDNNSDNKCPIVDAYFSHNLYQAWKNNKNESVLFKYSKENISIFENLLNTNSTNVFSGTYQNLFSKQKILGDERKLVYSTRSNSTYIDEYNSQNTLLLQMIGLHITRNGKCENGEVSLNSNYALVLDLKCSLSQRFYTTSKTSIVEVLNRNNNYYEYLNRNLALFDLNFSKEKWKLDLEYSFYRNTLKCIMKNYDDIFQNYFYDINEITLYKYQLQKLSNVLSSFLKLNKANIYVEYEYRYRL